MRCDDVIKLSFQVVTGVGREEVTVCNRLNSISSVYETKGATVMCLTANFAFTSTQSTVHTF